jgi:hypothetical protein
MAKDMNQDLYFQSIAMLAVQNVVTDFEAAEKLANELEKNLEFYSMCLKDMIVTAIRFDIPQHLWQHLIHKIPDIKTREFLDQLLADDKKLTQYVIFEHSADDKELERFVKSMEILHKGPKMESVEFVVLPNGEGPGTHEEESPHNA